MWLGPTVLLSTADISYIQQQHEAANYIEESSFFTTSGECGTSRLFQGLRGHGAAALRCITSSLSPFFLGLMSKSLDKTNIAVGKLRVILGTSGKTEEKTHILLFALKKA